MQLPRPLRGIIPPLATPLLDERTLDLEGLQRLIEHMIDGGVSGLFALGTTGEATSLSQMIRHQLVERVCDQVAGRVPVLVGITDTVHSASLELAETAHSAGAAALVAAPPYYLPMSQAEIVAYFERLANELPLPLFLYNIPVCTQTRFELEAVRELVGLPNVVGMKDSSGDLEFFAEVVELVKDDELFTMLIGPEQQLPEAMALGAHGGVCGGANMFPRLFADLYQACAADDQQRQQQLQQQVLRITADIYGAGSDPFAFIKCAKFVLGQLGICSDFTAPPLRSLRAEERQSLAEAAQAIFTDWGISATVRSPA